MARIQFFDFKQEAETQEDWRKRRTKSLNALAARVQGSQAEGIEGLEGRVEALEDELPAMGTAQATTSGTAWDFTGIPSWVTKIEGGISGFSTDGTSNAIIQIGPSGGVETSSYLGAAAGVVDAGATAANQNSTGFTLSRNHAATSVRHGTFTLLLIDSATNTWVFSQGIGGSDTTRSIIGGGSKALAGTLSVLRLTTVSGDNGDAGLFNIKWYA